MKHPPKLTLVENERYRYDAEKADRICRFFPTFLRHYEGVHVGKPFDLAPVQEQWLRDIHGYVDRETGYRQINEVLLEAAAGAGKSPLLAGLGLFHLMFDGEAGAQVYSVAKDYSQARIVFDTAKKFIELAPKKFRKQLVVTQYEIRHPKSKSFWRIISGKTERAGLRPSLVLGDELHEWDSRDVYDSLKSRMTKRRQALMILATNAGKSRQSLCWELHDEGVSVLSGKKVRENYYPLIYSTERAIDDPAGWAEANPLLGISISVEKVAAELADAVGNPALEARFRRLYLGQWEQGSVRWIDLNKWDAVSQPFDYALVNKLPLYVAIDASLGDDLFAVVRVWVSKERFYVDSHFFMTEKKAEEYDTKKQTTYRKWAGKGHVTLVPERSIGAVVQERIAKYVLDMQKEYELKAVCYDRAFARHCIAAIEAVLGDKKTLAIGQGWGVTSGCCELDSRLDEQSITIQPNPVMRFCAENVEVKTDDRGNYWPMKPNAKGKYAGVRAAKIDGISALVTALTEARKSIFVKAKARAGAVIISQDKRFALRK